MGPCRCGGASCRSGAAPGRLSGVPRPSRRYANARTAGVLATRSWVSKSSLIAGSAAASVVVTGIRRDQGGDGGGHLLDGDLRHAKHLFEFAHVSGDRLAQAESRRVLGRYLARIGDGSARLGPKVGGTAIPELREVEALWRLDGLDRLLAACGDCGQGHRARGGQQGNDCPLHGALTGWSDCRARVATASAQVPRFRGWDCIQSYPKYDLYHVAVRRSSEPGAIGIVYAPEHAVDGGNRWPGHKRVQRPVSRKKAQMGRQTVGLAAHVESEAKRPYAASLRPRWARPCRVGVRPTARQQPCVPWRRRASA